MRGWRRSSRPWSAPCSVLDRRRGALRTPVPPEGAAVTRFEKPGTTAPEGSIAAPAPTGSIAVPAPTGSIAVPALDDLGEALARLEAVNPLRVAGRVTEVTGLVVRA